MCTKKEPEDGFDNILNDIHYTFINIRIYNRFMKKILVILGHPRVKSYNGALADSYVKGAKKIWNPYHKSLPKVFITEY